MWRKVQQVGLATAYMERGAVYDFIRQLLALPYLPKRHIRPAFEVLKERSQLYEPTRELTNYVSQLGFTILSGVWATGVSSEDWFAQIMMSRGGTDA